MKVGIITLLQWGDFKGNFPINIALYLKIIGNMHYHYRPYTPSHMFKKHTFNNSSLILGELLRNITNKEFIYEIRRRKMDTYGFPPQTNR